MSNYTGKTERLIAFDNTNGCTNFGTMMIDGMKVWGLKTNGDNNKSVLAYSSDVDNVALTVYDPVENLLGHGNGMTGNSSYLWFACKPNSYIIRVPRGFKGVWSGNTVNITTPTAIGAMSHYGSNKHIVRVSTDVNGTDKFAYGSISVSGTTGTMTYNSYFYVTIDFSYDDHQDFFYDKTKELMFIPYSIKTNGNLVTNKIVVVNLAGSYTTTNGCKAYTPQDIITVDKSSNNDFRKYEIESLGLDSNRKIVMACNINRVSTDAYDSFQRITNLTY